MRNNKATLALLVVVVLASIYLLTRGGKSDETTPLAGEHVGVYLAGSPSADAPSVTRTLVMDNEQSVSLKSNYGNEKPAVTKIGTWETNDKNQIVVTITGQKNLVYDKPEKITFELKDGVLTAVEYNHDAYGSEGLVLVKQP